MTPAEASPVRSGPVACLGEEALGAVALNEEALARMTEVLLAAQLAKLAPITVDDMVASLTVADRQIIGGAWDDGKSAAVVMHGLRVLEQRGAVSTVPGGYAMTELPASVSRRRRTLSVCGRAAVALARAVRAGDVWEYALVHAKREIAAGGLTAALIARDLLNLVRTGDAVVVAMLHGESAVGRKLVVPAGFLQGARDWLPTTPLTWLEYVVEQVRLLVTHQRQAAEEPAWGTFTTKALRAHMMADLHAGVPIAFNRYGARLDDPMTVTRALRQLASIDAPVVRAVVGVKGVWSLSDHEPASESSPEPVAFSCDSDRLIAAARRATLDTGRSAVTAAEIALVIATEPALALSGSESVATALSDLAREKVQGAPGRRVARKRRSLIRVGTVRGRAAYWVAQGDNDEATLTQANAAVALDGLQGAIQEARFPERVAALNAVLSPTIALGRARQALAEAQSYYGLLEEMDTTSPVTVECRAAIDDVSRTLSGWIQFRAPRARSAPPDLVIEQRGFTALELRDRFAHINETARAMPTGAAVTRHFSRLIRRVHNTSFVNRRSGDTHTAAEWLFDEVDALAYAARQWGGSTCQLLALWALEEIGELRDPRYLVAALATEATEVRLRAVGGLALLRTPAGEDILRRHVRNDVDASVRECALWAMGMLIGERADATVREVAATDADRRVRRAAERFLDTGAQWWWRV